MSSLSQKQTEFVNRNRFKLLELFCKYDLGNLSKENLDQQLKELNIEPTQAYESFMRRQCGSLKFNEFVQTLSISDDAIVENMMNIPIANTNMTDEQILESPHRAKATGCFNTELNRYPKNKDFLKWKNAEHMQHNHPQQTAETSPQNIKQKLSAKATESEQLADDQCKSIKELLKMYCQDTISINELEQNIKESGMTLNASQQRLIAKCKINPNVKLSELILTFADPKQTKFSATEAKNAVREPLVFVSMEDSENILTWRGSTAETMQNDPITKKKSFIQPQTQSSILKWTEMTNEEYNIANKPPPLHTASKSFQSQIVFDESLVPQDESHESVPIGKRASGIFESTQNLLEWESKNTQKDNDDSEKVPPTTHEKFWADDRVPFVNSAISKSHRRHLDESN